MGFPQRSILYTVFFNLHLSEILKSSQMLEEVRNRGDLLAFADEVLVISKN
jgi:hypothetical protein